MATAPQKPAIIPGTKHDPTGAMPLEKRAMAEFARKMRLIYRRYKAGIQMLQPKLVVNASYTYELDQATLDWVFADLGRFVEDTLTGVGEDLDWFLNNYVVVASGMGVAQQFSNLSQQSAIYSSVRGSPVDILRSAPHLNRMALLRARIFEEMAGLSASVKADMSRILADGVGRGLSPTQIAKNLAKQTGMNSRRASRIARTEITGALRRAKWDEVEDAKDAYGFTSQEMHLSALSPTTRIDHALRHGRLYTMDEVRTWWSEGANSINCLCSTTTVLTDALGKPLVPAPVNRSIKVREQYEKDREEDKE